MAERQSLVELALMQAQAAKERDEKAMAEQGRREDALSEMINEIAQGDKVSDMTLVMHLVEELVEALLCALHLRKVMLGEDPSDHGIERMRSELAEEIGDVMNIYDVIRARTGSPAPFSREMKMRRWIGRLEDGRK